MYTQDSFAITFDIVYTILEQPVKPKIQAEY